MKKKILGAAFGAALLFGSSFVSNVENANAQVHVQIDCKGSQGHCADYGDVTYYGRAMGTIIKEQTIN